MVFYQSAMCAALYAFSSGVGLRWWYVFQVISVNEKSSVMELNNNTHVRTNSSELNN